MSKITFIGAGSTVFAKNVLGDILLSGAFKGSNIALMDIDKTRLEESYTLIGNINEKYNCGCKIKSYTDFTEACTDADYVINAAQIGGFEPCGVNDLEVPKKYGLLATVGDTLGVAGIFRTLRSAPAIREFLNVLEDVAPNCTFINYANPMAMLMGVIYKMDSVKSIGICHSVQDCVEELFLAVGIEDIDPDSVQTKIAGINHQAWLLEITKENNDLYPLIKQKAAQLKEKNNDMVRLEIMKRFGYFVTESSRHSSEYLPYFIKRQYPELIERFNIPIDAYIINSRKRFERWDLLKEELISKNKIEHTRTKEYPSYIMEALETGKAYRFHGNVKNTGLITNLPSDAIVEVPCVVDSNGILPCYMGKLPNHLAAINRTNINPQILAVDACFSQRKEDVYRAALLDPHTSAELSIDDIISLCDELFEVHKDWLPKFR